MDVKYTNNIRREEKRWSAFRPGRVGISHFFESNLRRKNNLICGYGSKEEKKSPFSGSLVKKSIWIKLFKSMSIKKTKEN